MTAILRTAASSSQAIGRFVRCAYSNFSLSRASRRVKIFMRLPDGRNGATRQAVHGTEWRPLDR